MFSLSTVDVLAIWERGERQVPFERGLAMLIRACPCLSRDDLASLAVVQRDALLLFLRERTFGPELKAFAVCPKCGDSLEFALRATELRKRLKKGNEAVAALRETTAGEYRIRLRPPNTADLAEAIEEAGMDDSLDRTKRLLLERCVSEATWKDRMIPFSELPKDVVERIGLLATEIESEGEIGLDLECPDCHHTWQMIFDIASFLYAEISVLAKRLLENVHALASAYGWSEREILTMSAARRQFYLDRVG